MLGVHLRKRKATKVEGHQLQVNRNGINSFTFQLYRMYRMLLEKHDNFDPKKLTFRTSYHKKSNSA